MAKKKIVKSVPSYGNAALGLLFREKQKTTEEQTK